MEPTSTECGDRLAQGRVVEGLAANCRTYPSAGVGIDRQKVRGKMNGGRMALEEYYVQPTFFRRC